jgi:hypothetical protein
VWMSETLEAAMAIQSRLRQQGTTPVAGIYEVVVYLWWNSNMNEEYLLYPELA